MARLGKGLRIRAIGDDPKTVETAGIAVLSLQSSDDSRPAAIEIPYLKNKYKI